MLSVADKVIPDRPPGKSSNFLDCFKHVHKNKSKNGTCNTLPDTVFKCRSIVSAISHAPTVSKPLVSQCDFHCFGFEPVGGRRKCATLTAAPVRTCIHSRMNNNISSVLSLSSSLHTSNRFEALGEEMADHLDAQAREEESSGETMIAGVASIPKVLSTHRGKVRRVHGFLYGDNFTSNADGGPVITPQSARELQADNKYSLRVDDQWMFGQSKVWKSTARKMQCREMKAQLLSPSRVSWAIGSESDARACKLLGVSPDMDLLVKHDIDSAQRIITISAQIRAHYMHASCENKWKLGVGGSVEQLPCGEVVDVPAGQLLVPDHLSIEFWMHSLEGDAEVLYGTERYVYQPLMVPR